MGLDMYLDAKKYISGWSHSKDPLFDPLAKLLGFQPCSESPSMDLSVRIGYWRKANAVHNWFVQNIQNGDDDGRAYRVSREKLEKLKQDCELVLVGSRTATGDIKIAESWGPEGHKIHTQRGEVITNPELAEKVMPYVSGFFFGCTDYNEFYLAHLERTMAIIKAALEMGEDWKFSYSASW